MHQQFNLLKPTGHVMHQQFNLLKPTGHVMNQQFNIQQLYVLPTLYLCVLYFSEKKQRLVPLKQKLIGFYLRNTSAKINLQLLFFQEVKINLVCLSVIIG